ncbi:MAG: amidohydrolase family protein [Acidimicrobiales bacterium]
MPDTGWSVMFFIGGVPLVYAVLAIMYLPESPRWHEVKGHPERAARIDPLRSALASGITFGLHSDCPVTPVPPLEGIWAAVNRMTRDGLVLGDRETIPVEAAIRAYTSMAARLSSEEHLKRTLEEGKLADAVVLSGDPMTVPPAGLADLEVEMTIVDGEVVWKGPGSPI